MQSARHTSPSVVRVSVLLVALGAGAAPVSAQRAPLGLPIPKELAYVSLSGMVAFGFEPYLEGRVRGVDLVGMLPPEADVPAMCRSLLDEMWEGSSTFRRQWMRIAGARVRVTIAFDRPLHSNSTHAEAEISRTPALSVRISLRGGDGELVEHLSHEIEHVLEQLDEVDLAEAEAAHIHGVSASGKRTAFETRRAVVVGRQVAAEVAAHRTRG
jgi:hypothetical protein